MNIRLANFFDVEILNNLDKHIKKANLIDSIDSNRVYIIEENNNLIGWLRYNLFWDNTPFMNMLYILKEYRGKGYGSSLLLYWENEMKKEYEMVMTSTVESETAKDFYYKYGYKNIGHFKSNREPLELVLMKEL